MKDRDDWLRLVEYLLFGHATVSLLVGDQRKLMLSRDFHGNLRNQFFKFILALVISISMNVLYLVRWYLLDMRVISVDVSMTTIAQRLSLSSVAAGFQKLMCRVGLNLK